MQHTGHNGLYMLVSNALFQQSESAMPEQGESCDLAWCMRHSPHMTCCLADEGVLYFTDDVAHTRRLLYRHIGRTARALSRSCLSRPASPCVQCARGSPTDHGTCFVPGGRRPCLRAFARSCR